MRSLSFKFLFLTLLIFSVFILALYLLDIPAFYFPHVPIVFTILYTEKSIRKRIILMVTAFLLYSQTGAPVPFLFLTVIFIQIYFFTQTFFSITAFDFTLTALLNAFLIMFVINFNRFLYVHTFTGDFNFFILFAPTFSSWLFLILIFIFFKPQIDKLFIKDSWL